jgi:hypothetical protein
MGKLRFVLIIKTNPFVYYYKNELSVFPIRTLMGWFLLLEKLTLDFPYLRQRNSWVGFILIKTNPWVSIFPIQILMGLFL